MRDAPLNTFEDAGIRGLLLGSQLRLRQLLAHTGVLLMQRTGLRLQLELQIRGGCTRGAQIRLQRGQLLQQTLSLLIGRMQPFVELGELSLVCLGEIVGGLLGGGADGAELRHPLRFLHTRKTMTTSGQPMSNTRGHRAARQLAQKSAGGGIAIAAYLGQLSAQASGLILRRGRLLLQAADESLAGRVIGRGYSSIIHPSIHRSLIIRHHTDGNHIKQPGTHAVYIPLRAASCDSSRA